MLGNSKCLHPPLLSLSAAHYARTKQKGLGSCMHSSNYASHLSAYFTLLENLVYVVAPERPAYNCQPLHLPSPLKHAGLCQMLCHMQHEFAVVLRWLQPAANVFSKGCGVSHKCSGLWSWFQSPVDVPKYIRVRMYVSTCCIVHGVK